MSLSSSLGAVRATTPRLAGAATPITAYANLLAAIKAAGLLQRSRVFYYSVFATLVVAHAAAAFYHHLFQQDTTLTRMLPGRRRQPAQSIQSTETPDA